MKPRKTVGQAAIVAVLVAVIVNAAFILGNWFSQFFLWISIHGNLFMAVSVVIGIAVFCVELLMMWSQPDDSESSCSPSNKESK